MQVGNEPESEVDEFMALMDLVSDTAAFSLNFSDQHEDNVQKIKALDLVS